ncbi:GIY-YIG nuclease family protein [Streptomyces sp. NPDC048211]|uniref:GIY-YIG nuclease family protein n=1 Tax=Streptomyces sp. NPDC048211 TaxID=3365516 RepID=UPI003714CC6C
METQRTALYRLYTFDGQLLYVGITNNPEVRFKWHAQMSWWHRVAEKAVEWHPDRGTARCAEAEAIKGEGPILNAMHAAAGPHDTPLRDARARLGRIIEQVRTQHEPRWLTNYGRRSVAIVHPQFCEEAVRNERIVNALREVNPALYEHLTADSD